jgi:hypothetical protein
MARVYLVENPPRSPVIFEYGGSFADFLERFEPLAGYPYLPDVARLERAWLDAFHAADADPLQAGDLGAIPPDAWLKRPLPHTRQRGSCGAGLPLFQSFRQLARNGHSMGFGLPTPKTG